ncbi:MAG TPA: YetF domain-containing protein [Terriglobales bacterium]|nr:YetF domain-containing protein [Terriglobales bacterium]
MPSFVVLAGILGRTACIYVLVLLGVRLTGKREVGQMTPFDLVLLLLLSNAVQNAMTGPDTSLAGGVIAALTLLVLNYVVAEWSGLNRRFRRLVQGSPSLLIHNGALVTAHLAKEHVTVDEIQRACREHGISEITDVALGVLEVDGSISLLKYDDCPASVHSPHRLKFLQKKQ